jgi:hypothetical protein
MSENLYSSDIQGDFNDSTIDNSGYGVLPAAEKNQNYFAYFEAVGGTGPEIIDQTSYFIKYLIDAQGNVVAPQPNSIDLSNMLQNFEPGKKVNVSSLEGTTAFIQLLGDKTITHVGKIETLMTTETGSGRWDYVRTMSYAAGPGGISEETAYNYAFKGIKSVSQYSQDMGLFSSYITLPCNAEPLDIGGNYNNSDYTYTFPNSTEDQGTLVRFIARVVVRMLPNPDQLNDSNWVYLTIEKQPGGSGPWQTIPNTSGQTYTNVQVKPTFGIKVQAYATPFMNFNTGDKVRARIKLDNGEDDARVYFYNADSNGNKTEFYNEQDYVTPNQINPPYWSIGTYTTASNEFTMITASSGITGMNQNQYSQVTPTGSIAFNFNNIYLPFTPQPGDFIRFEYNPSKVHTIYENTITTEGSMSLKIVPSVPTGSILNHFCIYRVNPNSGNQIILDVKKPNVTTGTPLTGFIKPQYMTKELEDSFTTIVQKLAAENTI